MLSKRLFLILLLILTTPTQANNLPDSATLDIQLTLPMIETSYYQRPYVAVWIENSDKDPINTIQLWVQDSEWHPDLRNWWRKIGRDQNEKIDAYSSATRGAGNHRFRWKVRGPDQKPLTTGQYYLNVEVVREDGERSYVREQLHLTNTPFKKSINTLDQTELTAVQINYLVN